MQFPLLETHAEHLGVFRGVLCMALTAEEEWENLP